MPAFTSTSPGKIILFGEHAVVYGQPAIAVPVTQVRARVTVLPQPRAPRGQVSIHAPDVGLQTTLDALPADHPLAAAIRGVMTELSVEHIPACMVRISSSIPVASGLGSGAAVSVALIRALAAYLGRPLADERVSALAFEVEKIHHGTPSGIDNTVVTYRQPVFFIKGRPLETFSIRQPFTLLIADTGVASPTKETVADVRAAWQAEPARYERLFAAAGSIARAARQAIEAGQPQRLGPLMNENHALLQEMGVSSHHLDALVRAAREAGALGAKLSGGGRGGNMIALVQAETKDRVARVLSEAGAVRVIETEVRNQE
ncbi:MAG: mevalonate kinase [Anaerolineae bacterium]|nr:MAG: mevalonate kinase [Anaerolineae bacterium]